MWLAALRERRGLTRADVANGLRTYEKRIQRYEEGQKLPATWFLRLVRYYRAETELLVFISAMSTPTMQERIAPAVERSKEEMWAELEKLREQAGSENQSAAGGNGR